MEHEGTHGTCGAQEKADKDDAGPALQPSPVGLTHRNNTMHAPPGGGRLCGSWDANYRPSRSPPPPQAPPRPPPIAPP